MMAPSLSNGWEKVRARLRVGLPGRLGVRLRDDRGSGAAAVLIFALVFMTLAGFVVDGGLSISQRERAADIAEQAARYAAEDIDVEALRNATGDVQPVINYQNCNARVQEYIGLINVKGTDVVASCTGNSGPQRVEVVVQLSYKPVLTGFFYKKDLTAKGKAAAEAVTDPG